MNQSLPVSLSEATAIGSSPLLHTQVENKPNLREPQRDAYARAFEFFQAGRRR